MERFAQKAIRQARRVLYAPFRPKELTIRQIQHRGMHLAVLANEDVGWHLISRGTYEEAELRCLDSIISTIDICVDVGANVGIYTIYMANRASSGRVFAFEPVPLARKILDLNVSLNVLTNVEISEYALSDTLGSAKFSVSKDAAYSSLRPTGVKEQARSLEVRLETLDSTFAKNDQRVDFVKIDVEGAEMLVLEGASELLSVPRLRPKALMVELAAENQRAYGYHPEDVVEHMKKLGYEAYSVTHLGPKKGWVSGESPVDALFLRDDAG